MSREKFSENHFINTGLTPAADSLSGTVDSDWVSTALYSRVVFIVIRGTATGGTADHTFTVQCASDNAGTGAEAIEFKFREGTLAGVLGDLTDATAAGYLNTAGSDRMDVIEVDAAHAVDTKPFVNLHSVENTDDPVVATIVTVLFMPSYEEAIMPDPT